MQRVAAGELPETLRLIRDRTGGRVRQAGQARPGYDEAVAAARELGFGSVLRLAGGRAAVFHEGTLELAHAVPDANAQAGIQGRFEATADLVARR